MIDMTGDDEIFAPYRVEAERRVRANPALADVVAAADAETGDRWLARNRLALEIEWRMPGIVESVAIVRAARKPKRRFWSGLLR